MQPLCSISRELCIKVATDVGNFIVHLDTQSTMSITATSPVDSKKKVAVTSSNAFSADFFVWNNETVTLSVGMKNWQYLYLSGPRDLGNSVPMQWTGLLDCMD